MPSFLVINKSCLIDFLPLPPLSWLLFSESQRAGGEGGGREGETGGEKEGGRVERGQVLG